MIRRWSAAVLATALVAAGLTAALVTAADAQDATSTGAVQIGGLRPGSGGSWGVLVSPPASRPITLYGADAFTVTADGAKVASQAKGLSPGDLAIGIVVQAGVASQDLKTEQAAAVETVLGLPASARTTVVASGDSPKVLAPLGTDRRAATAAVGKVERVRSANALAAVALAAEQIRKEPRQAIILFGPAGFVSANAIDSLARTLIDRHVPLFSVTPNNPSKDFGIAAVATGGRAVSSGSSSKPDAAVGAGQAIATQLANQYLVTFTPRTKPTSDTKITVALAGVHGSEAAVPQTLLPGGAASLTPSGPAKGRDVPWALVGAAAAVLVVVLVLIALLVARRRRRARAEPAFRVTATRAVRAAPPPEPEPEPDTDAVAGSTPEPEMEPGAEAETVPSAAPAAVVTTGRHRHPLGASPRTGQVDEALDRLEAFASRWQPRSQGIFFAQEALAIHEHSGVTVSLDELSRATALDSVTAPVLPVVRTIEALRWSLVRRSQGGRWSDIAVEASAVLRGELDAVELMRAPVPTNGSSNESTRSGGGQLERLRGRRALEDEVPLREPVRAAAIARERVLEYQWFGAESEVVSRLLIPVLLYDRVPAAVPYLGISRHLGDDTDVSTFYEAATAAADEATRRVVQLRALRSRYQADLDVETEPEIDHLIELLFSVPVVTAGHLTERLDSSAAKVTELMDHLVSAGVVQPLREPTRRGDPAWVAIEVLAVFDREPGPAAVNLADPDPAESEIPDRGTPRRRAAPARPRQLRARPRP